MIASHDTYSYLCPVNWARLIPSCFWRCQDLTIDEQYAKGVRYFDVRVIRQTDGWHAAHGVCDFGLLASTIRELAEYFRIQYPDAMCRIVLERGNWGDMTLLVDEVNAAWDIGNIQWLVRKKPWATYRWQFAVKIIDRNFHFSFRNFFTSSIRKFASAHRPSQWEYDDKNAVYFYDFI